MPFGKYWRTSPLVFSLLPRCQGECGSNEIDLQPSCRLDALVVEHFVALVPGQGPAQFERQLGERCDQGIPDVLGRVAIRQSNQQC